MWQIVKQTNSQAVKNLKLEWEEEKEHRTSVLIIPFHEVKLNSKGNKNRTQHQIILETCPITNRKSCKKKGSNIMP